MVTCQVACLYTSVKKGLGVHLATEQEFPYYPNCYFCCQVANWLVKNRQKVMLTQKAYLRQAYGIQDLNATFPGPYSYKEYCCHVLDRRFWGDALVLYTISSMWALKITMVNSKTLAEYQVQHTAPLRKADIGLVYNVSCHYTAAGRLSSAWVTCYSLIANGRSFAMVACCILSLWLLAVRSWSLVSIMGGSLLL